MADNTRLNSNTTSGDLIASDDVADGGVADGSKVQRIKAGFGGDGSYTDPCIANPFPVTPPTVILAEMAAGNVDGWDSIFKYGQNQEIDSGGTEDIWDGGGIYDWPAAAALMQVSSASPADSFAGVGARTIQVFGLDTNYEPISETATLDGTNPVNLTESYLRVYRIRVLTAGSLGHNEGDIQMEPRGGGTLLAQVSATNNTTQMALYTVPAGKTMYLTGVFASIYNAATRGAAELEFRVRPQGGVFYEQFNAGFAGDGTTSLGYTFSLPLAIPEKTDMLARATVTQNNTSAIAIFSGLLKDNA